MPPATLRAIPGQSTGDPLIARYSTLVRRAARLPEPTLRSRARQLGRQWRSDGLKPGQIAKIHHSALELFFGQPNADAVAFARVATRVLAATLSAFDESGEDPIRRGISVPLVGNGVDSAPPLQTAALRQLNERLEERAKQIAHALHDEAGQMLASVYLQLSDVERSADAAPVARLRMLLDQVDAQIRRLAHELRPTILDELGLVPACRFLADGVAQRTGVRVVVQDKGVGRLPTDLETAVYRVVQESLTNATRHGRPTEVFVALAHGGRSVSGYIEDNGLGFDTQVHRRAEAGRGLGLLGMRERLAAFGGTLTITSAPGRGTAVRFDVPLEMLHGDYSPAC